MPLAGATSKGTYGAHMEKKGTVQRTGRLSSASPGVLCYRTLMSDSHLEERLRRRRSERGWVGEEK